MHFWRSEMSSEKLVEPMFCNFVLSLFGDYPSNTNVVSGISRLQQSEIVYYWANYWIVWYTSNAPSEKRTVKAIRRVVWKFASPRSIVVDLCFRTGIAAKEHPLKPKNRNFYCCQAESCRVLMMKSLVLVVFSRQIINNDSDMREGVTKERTAEILFNAIIAGKMCF